MSDPSVMGIDGNRKERLRGKGSSSGLSISPYTIIIDENQERVEQGREEKGGGLLLPIHTPWQETGHRKERHTSEHECPNYL